MEYRSSRCYPRVRVEDEAQTNEIRIYNSGRVDEFPASV